MSKFLFYLALLFMLGATLLGYWNERRFKYVIMTQESVIQDQQEHADQVEKELKEVKESLNTQSSDQEKNKKELSDAKEVETKAASDLTQAQKQLADKEAEMTQLKNDLATKTARIQELEAATQLLAQSEDSSKSKNLSASSTKGKGAHAESKKTAAPNKKESADKKDSPPACAAGKVLAVNTTWNFIVLNVGSQEGMLAGTELAIRRQGQMIGKAKVTSVESSTSAADLLVNTLASGMSVEAGDEVIVSEKEMGK